MQLIRSSPLATTLVAVAVGLVSFLSGCSRETDQPAANSPIQVADSATVTDNTFGGHFRPGEMEIKVRIQQKAALETTIPAKPPLQVYEKTVVRWSFMLDAQSRQSVFVPQDLSQSIPENGSPEEIRSAYENPPFYIADDAAPAVISGKVSYSLDSNYHRPDASEFTSMTQVAAGTGNIETLTIPRVHPSRVGKGYELELDLVYNLPVKHTDTWLAARKSFLSRVENSEKSHSARMLLRLYPSPGTTMNPYPYDTDALPAELKGAERKGAEDAFALLKQIAAGRFPVIDGIRPGMTTRASKDELIFHYEYADKRQIITGYEAFGEPDPNVISIDIIIRAK